MWTLPDPTTALMEWGFRIRPGGTLILIEGRWREASQSATPYVADFTHPEVDPDA